MTEHRAPVQPELATDTLLLRGIDRWRQFWFSPQPMTTLGLVRIAFGLLMICWTFSLLPDLLTFFGPNGVVQSAPSVRYAWGLLHIFTSERAAIVVWVVLLAAAIALTVGWHSRLAALVVFVVVMSFERRNIFVFNSGDVVLRIEALYLVLAPSGAALSLDRLRTAGSFWSAQVRAPWVLRLMQVQLSLIYLSTVHDKLTGTTWNQGTAVSYALRLSDLAAVPVPHWLSTNPELMNLATWGTLVLELSLGVLVWNRRVRPWILTAGVLMHLIFVVTLAVAFFSFGMYVLYLAFLPTEAADRVVGRVRGWLPNRAQSAPPSTDGDAAPGALAMADDEAGAELDLEPAAGGAGSVGGSAEGVTGKSAEDRADAPGRTG